MASTAIQALVEKNQRLEAARKQAREEGKAATGIILGFGSALVASAASGYLDGRFDIAGKDQISGDGIRVMGMPVMPLAAAATLVAGLAVGGLAGQTIAFAGLGVACQSTGGMTANAGRQAYQKSLTK